MAKEEKAKKPKKKGRWLIRLNMFFGLVLAITFLPSTIIFLVTMMPTLVAVIVDKTPQKAITMTVGSMNLAGMVPAWLKLWSGGHTIPVALEIALNPFVLLVAFGAAGAGWAIYRNIIPFVANVAAFKAQRRLKMIEVEQQKLRKKWGDEVAG